MLPLKPTVLQRLYFLLRSTPNQVFSLVFYLSYLHYLIIAKDKMTWEQARISCNSLGSESSLPKIYNHIEHAALRELVNKEILFQANLFNKINVYQNKF